MQDRLQMDPAIPSSLLLYFLADARIYSRLVLITWPLFYWATYYAFFFSQKQAYMM